MAIMGVHLLQTFISSRNDYDSIQEKHLREFAGKKITIDISIYLYRFKEKGDLLENIYLMCSILRFYNIDVLFIFDGKYLKNKSNTMRKRKDAREKAKSNFDKLSIQFNKYNGYEKRKIELQMDQLRKKFIVVTKEDIAIVKTMLDSYGMTYVSAKREADELCGALTKEVYACLTEDTDIMAYGCNRVLRYFSLIKHTVVVYNMASIRHNLNMTLQDFQELCVCSGNDYIESKENIFHYYDLFKKYKKTAGVGFLDWLPQKRYITLQEYHIRQEIYDMYTFKLNNPFEGVPYTMVRNKHIQVKKLVNLLETIGFIFP